MPKLVQNTSASGTSAPIVQEPASENKLKQQFHLVTTLLNLSHSEVNIYLFYSIKVYKAVSYTKIPERESESKVKTLRDLSEVKV